MDKIEKDCIWVMLKTIGPTFFKSMANRLDKTGRFCSELRGCDRTIILSVTEFRITIFEI